MPKLVILGMHRSYTSVTAEWLRDCGLDIGQNLLGAGRNGHSEDLDFLNIHKAILRDNGLPETGMIEPLAREFDFAGYESIAISPERAMEAQALLASKPDLSGWKEPRTCLFLPLYRELLDGDGRYLVLFRHYAEVVDSLIARDLAALRRRKLWRLRFPFGQRQIERTANAYLGAWIFYNRQLLEHIEAADPDRVTFMGDGAASRIRSWGFPLSERPFPKLTARHAPFRPYDEQLVAEADCIMDRLRAHQSPSGS